MLSERMPAGQSPSSFSAARRVSPLTFGQLANLEPGLESLRRHAVIVAKRHGQRRMWFGWSQVKRLLVKLVGWEAEHPALRSSDCYDLAHRTILDAYEIAVSQIHGGQR